MSYDILKKIMNKEADETDRLAVGVLMFVSVILFLVFLVIVIAKFFNVGTLTIGN